MLFCVIITNDYVFGDFEMKKRIVIKVGTSSLTYDTGKTNIARMAKLVSVISDLKNMGCDIVLVSSGAVGIGLSKLGIADKPAQIPPLQAAAAIGQCELMFLYDKFFSEYGYNVAQMLLTTEDVQNAESRGHIIDVFNQLLEYGTVPVVNENDSVSVDELKKGDNDCLSAIVATLIKADMLIMLTDKDGMYDKDPTENDDANLISYVEEINSEIYSIAGGASSKGTGGFATKVKAAEIATSNGITTYVINGDKPTAIYKILNGEQIGTRFAARGE